jgi:hypothetical protein
MPRKMSRSAHCAGRPRCRSFPAMGIAGIVLITAATAAAPYFKDRG